MPVKILTAALLSTVMMVAPAAAATVSAEIAGHDVHSTFLPGGFIPLPQDLTQDTSPSAFVPPADTQAVSGPSVLLNTSKPSFFNPGSQTAAAPEQQSGSSGSGTLDPIIGGGGSSPGMGVGTVPLPGALPMFGLALLVLCGLGARVRRRAAQASS